MAPKPAIPRPPKTAADTQKILAALSTQHPNADTELRFGNAYELLVATILSAQCTDERVNQVTPALFKRYPNAAALAAATTDELEPQIQSTGFFRAKSRSLAGMASEVVEQHGGDVPRTMEQLVKLPGVGRKTANVVLGHALGVPGLPVDRHVLRVANRIGIASAEDPETVEQQLGKSLPSTDWTRASDTLILHGRRICKPKPLCPDCVVRPDCRYYRNVVAKFGPAGGRIARVPTVPRRPEPGSWVEEGRAAKARSVRVGPGPSSGSPESGPLGKERRAAKPEIPSRGRGPRSGSPESGPLVKERRATKPARHSRGGGAPREVKK
ncbi:MAG: endonuclease III [Acidobacteria bacterium]|nr:endonuclease III [Acidobacteriota bacterium]